MPGGPPPGAPAGLPLLPAAICAAAAAACTATPSAASITAQSRPLLMLGQSCMQEAGGQARRPASDNAMRCSDTVVASTPKHKPSSLHAYKQRTPGRTALVLGEHGRAAQLHLLHKLLVQCSGSLLLPAAHGEVPLDGGPERGARHLHEPPRLRPSWALRLQLPGCGPANSTQPVSVLQHA